MTALFGDKRKAAFKESIWAILRPVCRRCRQSGIGVLLVLSGPSLIQNVNRSFASKLDHSSDIDTFRKAAIRSDQLQWGPSAPTPP